MAHTCPHTTHTKEKRIYQQRRAHERGKKFKPLSCVFCCSLHAFYRVRRISRSRGRVADRERAREQEESERGHVGGVCKQSCKSTFHALLRVPSGTCSRRELPLGLIALLHARDASSTGRLGRLFFFFLLLVFFHFVFVHRRLVLLRLVLLLALVSICHSNHSTVRPKPRKIRQEPI